MFLCMVSARVSLVVVIILSVSRGGRKRRSSSIITRESGSLSSHLYDRFRLIFRSVRSNAVSNRFRTRRHHRKFIFPDFPSSTSRLCQETAEYTCSTMRATDRLRTVSNSTNGKISKARNICEAHSPGSRATNHRSSLTRDRFALLYL
jgi:hypothetical protein